MIRFNLRGAHLGDCLLAMPAMREGDEVMIAEQHRVPFLNVRWLDPAPSAGLSAGVRRGRHRTESWLALSGRDPRRHALLAAGARDLLVLAPNVRCARRRWHGFAVLAQLLPGAAILCDKTPRVEWMQALNRAHTVVCPDTGTAHMADALGVPKVIGLYGSGFEDAAPYWNRSHCVVRNGMDNVTIDDVIEAIHG